MADRNGIFYTVLHRMCADELAGRYSRDNVLGWLRWTGRAWEPAAEVEVTEVIRRFVLAEVRNTLPQVADNTAARRTITDLMARDTVDDLMQCAGQLLRAPELTETYREVK